MAMSARKKKGLGFLVSGLVTAIVGIVLMVTTETPQWVDISLLIVSAVTNAIGIVFVIPDTSTPAEVK